MIGFLSALLMQAAATAPMKAAEVNWAAKPSALVMAAAFPGALSRTHLIGRAEIQCEVIADGRLGRCATLSESPADAGVGAAALSVTPSFRMTARTGDGASTTGRTVQIPIVFIEPGARLEPMLRHDPAFPSGEAEVNCRVNPGGLVDDCLVLSERPYDKGLGAEALRLTSHLGLRTHDSQRFIATYRFRP